MLEAQLMNALPEYFKSITDPRRAQGRRHRLATVLSIAAGAMLCGRTTYKAMAEWAESLGQQARKRFKCYYHYDQKSFQVPSETIIRNVLIRVNPDELNAAIHQWNQQFSQDDESLAIDGKTLCNAIDDEGRQTHIISAVGHESLTTHTKKKVGTLPVDEHSDEEKQTNEIKMVEPLLRPLDLGGMTITADALLTQRAIAVFLVEEKTAHYQFTVKANQKNLLDALELAFVNRLSSPDHETLDSEHGRIETRKIWVNTNTKLMGYLDFPHVRQAFLIERETFDKKTGKTRSDCVYGITSAGVHEVKPADILKKNRGHWCIENSSHHILDTTYDEDRSTIRTGYGPENTTCLRRFAISTIKSISKCGVAQTTRKLASNTRTVFDYLKMTLNTNKKSMTYGLE